MLSRTRAGNYSLVCLMLWETLGGDGPAVPRCVCPTQPQLQFFSPFPISGALGQQSLKELQGEVILLVSGNVLFHYLFVSPAWGGCLCCAGVTPIVQGSVLLVVAAAG